jgi:tight adherence protein B
MHRRRKRLQAFEEQLPNALSVIARSLRAGLPFSEALNMVAKEM